MHSRFLLSRGLNNVQHCNQRVPYRVFLPIRSIISNLLFVCVRYWIHNLFSFFFILILH